jgi:hypothetical protein
MAPRAGAPFITPMDLLVCRNTYGMSDSSIECLAFGKMCLALPEGIRECINQKIHGDPDHPETYLVRYDPLQKPVDLVNDSAYPEEVRGLLPPEYDFECFYSIGTGDADLDYSTCPEEAKRRAFFAGDFLYFTVWVWIEDEEAKDSRWEEVDIHDVEWAKHGLEGADEAFRQVQRLSNINLIL